MANQQVYEQPAIASVASDDRMLIEDQSDSWNSCYTTPSQLFLDRANTFSEKQTFTSTSGIELDVAGANDAIIVFDSNGADRITIGVDASNSYAFTIDNGGSLGASPLVVVETTGNVGIGIASPDGTMHVHTATAGAVTAAANYDDLVVENSTHGGISILTPNTVWGSIAFGDPDDADVGIIAYAHNVNAMLFYVNASEMVRIDSSGKFGIGTTGPDQLLDIEGADASIDVNATSGHPAVYWEENGTDRYAFQYHTTNNWFHLYGYPQAAAIFRVYDASTDLRANTDWVDDYFDWVCHSCGWHSATRRNACPDCDGPIEWQDDAALVHRVIHGTDKEVALRTLEKQGLVDMSDAVRTPVGYKNTFMSFQGMHKFTLSAVAQLWQRVTRLEAENKRLKLQTEGI